MFLFPNNFHSLLKSLAHQKEKNVGKKKHQNWKNAQYVNVNLKIGANFTQLDTKKKDNFWLLRFQKKKDLKLNTYSLAGYLAFLVGNKFTKIKELVAKIIWIFLAGNS